MAGPVLRTVSPKLPSQVLLINQAIQGLFLLMTMMPVLMVQAGKPRPVVWNVSKATIQFLALSRRRLSPPQQASACSVPSAAEGVQCLYPDHQPRSTV